jgi:carbamoyltransferase
MLSGQIGTVSNGEFTSIRELGVESSLGLFYTGMTRVIGYDHFDEYKVMGLAPYGDPSRYRDLFKTLYKLAPDGCYQLRPSAPYVAWNSLKTTAEFNTLRRKGGEFTQAHMDFAASLQETLEVIAMHVIGWFRENTGKSVLGYAGGVAHNCTLNGKLLLSGMFDDVFVQPAAHDAGTAVGAALYADRLRSGGVNRQARRLDHVLYGNPIPEGDLIEQRLADWSVAIRYERLQNTAQSAARLIADGAVIGWVQGRSEFGPRALGNRSILADPRPEQNRERINMMIKKREGYRPFAPSVLEESLHEYFEVPAQVRSLPFMIFVVPVRADKQAGLGAITHTDGTARVQTVSREQNSTYWQLIREFGNITGVPMLLNTSFNNNAEPIVESVDDAIACYLTTELTHLVVGDYLVTRRQELPDCAAEFGVSVKESYRITAGKVSCNGKA